MAGGALTQAGREYRESIEIATDQSCEVVLDALGLQFEELLDLLKPWGLAIQEAAGYPAQGPHELAAR
jgi:hypothetical protein